MAQRRLTCGVTHARPTLISSSLGQVFCGGSTLVLTRLLVPTNGPSMRLKLDQTIETIALVILRYIVLEIEIYY